MRLPCWKTFVLAFVFTAACHETTGPQFGIRYGLHSVDGGPLPAIQRIIGSDTVRVVRSVITLGGKGIATFSDDLITVHLNSPPVANTAVYSVGYDIKGDTIAFYCVGPLDCIGLPTGVISGQTLTVSGSYLSPRVFLYLRLPI